MSLNKTIDFGYNNTLAPQEYKERESELVIELRRAPRKDSRNDKYNV